MSTLMLDRADLEVRMDGDALAFYEAGSRRGSVPLKLLQRCIVQGVGTKLEVGVLLRLAEAGVPTVLISPRQGRRVATVLGAQHNDAAVRLAQAQRVWDPAWCLDWARLMVGAKLAHQEKVLREWLNTRPDARKPLHDAVGVIHSARAAVASAPSTDALRGLEGAAARAHFAGLAAVVPPSLEFNGRNRRPPRDPVNACLSLGYTLLHVDAVAACHQVGLDPLLGFFHRPSFGRESLASDLIEPLRAHVDRWLCRQLRIRHLRDEHFSHHNGACVIGKAGRSAFYSAWEANAKPLRRWLRSQARQLANTLRGEGLALLEPPPLGGDEA